MQSGHLFASRYLIEARLGRGGMGVVYQALDERLHRRVALKLMSPEFSRDSEFRARFDREASTAAAFEHANVVHVYDYAEQDGVLYIAMRFVAGRDLRAELEVVGSFELDRAVDVIGQIAAGLDAAHEHGHVHRDVKPANVLLERTAEGRERALVTDFGLAQPQNGGQGLTSSGKVIGTPAYMAPEQLMGQRASVRSDVYALACLAFECLSGHPPFPGSTDAEITQGHLSGKIPDLRRLVPGLPEGVALAVERGLSKQAVLRPSTAGAFASALAAASGSAAGAARTVEYNRVGPGHGAADQAAAEAGPTVKPSRRVRHWAAAAATVAVVALAGATVAFYASAGSNARTTGSTAFSALSAPPSSPPSAAPEQAALPEDDPHQTVAARLPADVFTDCAPHPEREDDGRVTSLSCSPVMSGADELLVTQWTDGGTMLASFARYQGLKDDGKCGAYDGTVAVGLRSTWGPDRERPMACYINDNEHAILMWEYPDQALQVIAVSYDRTGSAELFDWWEKAVQSPLR